MLTIVIVSILVAVNLALIIGKRNYVVIRRYEDKEGIQQKQVLKKFWRVEDALKYISAYDWYASDVALNLLNVSRKDGYIKVKDAVFNSQLVYFVTSEGREGTSFASQQELDAIKSISGYESDMA